MFAFIAALAIHLAPLPPRLPEPRLQLASITTTGAGKRPAGGGGGACNGTLDLSTGCAVPLGPVF